VDKEYTIEVSISQDDLVASIKVVTRTEDIGSISTSDLFKALSEEGVTYGIWEDIVRQISEDTVINKWVTVAKGEKPLEGKDGYVKYLFSKEGKKANLKEDITGRVNIKDMNLIQNVRKGDVLCELVPPDAGKSGMSVKGNEILGKVGAAASLPQGKNVEVSQDKTKLLSAIDGMVVWDDSGVLVEPVYVVEMVDSSTGNVRFNGSVIVNGEVGDGFEIHAGEDVTIAMSVGRVVITAGGNISIAGGILGQEKAEIYAKGSIHVKFVQDASIKAGQEIVIEDYVRNSEVTAGGPVIIKSPSGWITGSTISSEGWIYGHTIGHETNPVSTSLIIGHNPRLHVERENKRTEVIEKIGDFLKLQASNSKMRILKTQGKLSAQQSILYDRIIDAIDTTRHNIINIDERIRELTNKINTVFSGNIYIEGIANEGTIIMIGRGRRELTDTRVKTQFSLENNDIVESEFIMLPEIKEYLESQE